jgi:hypothetical protein
MISNCFADFVRKWKNRVHLEKMLVTDEGLTADEILLETLPRK